MKYNQKGFTLIELLAVIVILAIIALITTPAILNVVNDSRKKAAVDSTYGVIEAVKNAYTQNQMDSNAINGNKTITFNGSTVQTIGSRKVTITGDQPTSGTVTITASTGVVSASKVKLGDFYCSTYTYGGTAHAKVCCTTTDTVCTSE